MLPPLLDPSEMLAALIAYNERLLGRPLEPFEIEMLAEDIIDMQE